MKQLKVLLFALILVLVLNVAGVQAAELEYYGVEDVIRENLTVKTTVTMKFSEVIEHIDYQVYSDFYGLTVSKDFSKASCSKTEIAGKYFISCDFRNMTEENNLLELSFVQKNKPESIDGKYRLEANHGIGMSIDSAFVLIKLPENSILTERPVNSSYFPQDGRTLTDGRNIMVYWEKEGLETGRNLEFSVVFGVPQHGGMPMEIVIYLSVVVIVTIFGTGLYLKKFHKSGQTVTSVLNKNEKAVVDCLRAHDGKARQKTIVRETDFSKAKVSRLVNSLKERGVVDTEPISGRENRVVLKLD